MPNTWTKEERAKYRADNKEKIAAYNARYRKENREAVNKRIED